MTIDEAIQLLRSEIPVPRTTDDRNLSYREKQIRDAFSLLEEVARQKESKHYD